MEGIKLRRAFSLLLCIAGIFTACGRMPGKTVLPQPSTVDAEIEIPADSAETSDSPVELTSMQEMFGADCISEQTFQVRLGGDNGKVWFVPFAPPREHPEFRVQLIREGEVLEELSAYVPEGLAGEDFRSLDEVSFFDMNYDGSTDILLLVTYGDTRIAAVYYGEGNYFYCQEEVSDKLSSQADSLTCSGIRSFLSGGKENGEFTCWQEAYAAVSRVYDLRERKEREDDLISPPRLAYDLIDFDGDGIPELAASINGYYMSLYTYDAGRVYCLMNDWAYGAWGNAGYQYAPGKNSLRNDDADFAGAIVYTTYMTANSEHSLEHVVTIKTLYFEDVNGNGQPDNEDEYENFEPVRSIDGVEVTEEECAAYDKGDYRWIAPEQSLEELLEKLEWFPSHRPDWHIPVASGREYDLYLDGISTDIAFSATEKRRLYFSVYDKKGALVQELTETSPYLINMPEADFVENIGSIDWEEGQGHFAGNFYIQDMNFDGKEDLVLLWMNIGHPYWKVYLWREEEGVFREEPAVDGEEEQGVFCYYNISYEKQYIDEYIPEWDGHTIYRYGYDESEGYFCQGALSVHFGGNGDNGNQESKDHENGDSENVKYQEYFYENGVFTEKTGTICQEEVSEIWSDLFKQNTGT